MSTATSSISELSVPGRVPSDIWSNSENPKTEKGEIRVKKENEIAADLKTGYFFDNARNHGVILEGSLLYKYSVWGINTKKDGSHFFLNLDPGIAGSINATGTSIEDIHRYQVFVSRLGIWRFQHHAKERKAQNPWATFQAKGLQLRAVAEKDRDLFDYQLLGVKLEVLGGSFHIALEFNDSIFWDLAIQGDVGLLFAHTNVDGNELGMTSYFNPNAKVCTGIGTHYANLSYCGAVEYLASSNHKNIALGGPIKENIPAGGWYYSSPLSGNMYGIHQHHTAELGFNLGNIPLFLGYTLRRGEVCLETSRTLKRDSERRTRKGYKVYEETDQTTTNTKTLNVHNFTMKTIF